MVNGYTDFSHASLKRMLTNLSTQFQVDICVSLFHPESHMSPFCVFFFFFVGLTLLSLSLPVCLPSPTSPSPSLTGFKDDFRRLVSLSRILLLSRSFLFPRNCFFIFSIFLPLFPSSPHAFPSLHFNFIPPQIPPVLCSALHWHLPVSLHQ